jgi:hypothetical protein
MKAFIVVQWNGMDYDEANDYNAGIFASLEEAVKYCEATPASDYYGTPIEPEKAYRIEEWEDTSKKDIYTHKGVKSGWLTSP